MNVSIVVADDHPLMLKGLTDVIVSKGYSVIGAANNGNSAYNFIVKNNPDIAVLDIRMPFKTGLEIAKLCKKNKLKTKIVLITFDTEPDIYNKARQYGVYGYLLKQFAVKEIETCLEHVYKGEYYFSEKITEHLNANIESNNQLAAIQLLTKTELKVVILLSENFTNSEIAHKLSCSIRTIEKHRSNIVNKLNLQRSYNALVVWALLNKENLRKV